MHLLQYFLHLAAGDDNLSCLHHSVSWFPVTFQHAVSHHKGFPLGPIALVDGAPVDDVPPLWALSSLHRPQQRPNKFSLFYRIFCLLIWEGSGILAALTSEASWMVRLLGTVAICYSMFVLFLGEVSTILSHMMQSAVYCRRFEN
jgi:hypothetical protein